MATKVPAAQLVHADAPAAEYWPAAQVPVAAGRPEVAQKEPEGQGEQAVAEAAE